MTVNIDEVAAQLEGQFDGELVWPHSAGYDAARRIWNAMIDRRPGLIAKCTSVADVQAAVRAAAAADVLVAVRCGGHSLAGHSTCDDGLVIDLSPMNDIEVDVEARLVRAAGGCLLGDVDSATGRFGLATPAGVVSHTGLSGLVLGGGYGWMTRKHGLSCDNVRSFEIVLADGSVRRASADENQDLFWALRGGGGNFGIVTEFELELHPVSTVVLGGGYVPAERILDAVRLWSAHMAQAPEELAATLLMRRAPDEDDVPAHLRGTAVAFVSAAWIGEGPEGEQAVDELLALLDVEAPRREVHPFVELQRMNDVEFPHGRCYYTKSGYLDKLGDAVVARLVAALDGVPSEQTLIELGYQGGVAARVPAEATAFGDRSAPYLINLLGSWLEPADSAANVGWVRELFAAIRPDMTPGVYVNYMSADEPERVTEAYDSRFEELTRVKTSVDPHNLFRLNHNIVPLPASATGA